MLPLLRGISLATMWQNVLYVIASLIALSISGCSAKIVNNHQIVSSIPDTPHISIVTKASPNSILLQNTSNTSERDDSSSLLTINSMMFLFYATLGSALPYLPVYYRSIGITGQCLSFLS